VHAAGQAAHLDAPFLIPPAGLTRALNGILPADLRVLSCRRVPPGFHACLDCAAKRYRYRFAWGGALDPWEGLRRWELPIEPDLGVMRSCVRILPGTHDFAAFALSGHAGHGARGTRRTIFAARLGGAPRHADLVVEGDGFLRGMVRRIAGALVEVGRGAREVSWFEDLLDDRAAKPPAPTAPAHGLTLERVFYAVRAGSQDAAQRHGG
jgi:tRNA pseudouridine38-40 synthase